MRAVPIEYMENPEVIELTLDKARRMLCNDDVLFYDHKYSRTILTPSDVDEHCRYVLKFWPDKKHISLSEYTDFSDGIIGETLYIGYTDGSINLEHFIKQVT